MSKHTELSIIGKYAVIQENGGNKEPNVMLTDNPLEAVWEANKFPTRRVENICGEREVYKENGVWKARK